MNDDIAEFRRYWRSIQIKQHLAATTNNRAVLQAIGMTKSFSAIKLDNRDEYFPLADQLLTEQVLIDQLLREIMYAFQLPSDFL